MEQAAIDLREYVAVLRARKWTILLTALLVLGSALYFSYQQTPLYTAKSRLLVKGVPSDASGYVPPPNLETEAEIVASTPVATEVLEQVDVGLSAPQLIAGLEVEPVSELANVLEISFTAETPELAQDVPNAFATGYIEYKRNRAREALTIGRQAIEDRIEAVQERLTDVGTRIRSVDPREDPALATTLETERSTLIARLGVLQQRLDDYRARQPINLAGGEIIEPATLPLSPSSPDHIRNGLLAAALGLSLGIGIALLRERLDDRFRGRMDVVRVMEAPVLAGVPRMKVRRKNPHVLAMDADPRGHTSEAFRSLRTGIEFIGSERDVRSFLITSASPGEGKTSTTANLGVSLAHAGRRTILVSSDLRRPTLEHYFGIPQGPGLADWLLGDGGEDINAFVQDPGIANMRVMPSGRIPQNPAELLSSPRLERLIATLESNSDIVLFDSAPVLAVADSLILASRVGGTIIVLDANKTDRSAATHAKEELQRVGGRIFGTVLNAFDPSGSPYNHYQSYSSGYGRDVAIPAGNGGESSRGRTKQRSGFGFRR